jgi:hypothetical protein
VIVRKGLVMRKFIAIILGLALTCGLVVTTGNPTITRADKEESPVVGTYEGNLTFTFGISSN